jgi:hypothetical protein
MNRRVVIKNCGVAIFASTAGCLGSTSTDRDQNRSVSSVDVQVLGIDQMDATGEIVQSEITSDSQGVIRLGMRWEGNWPITVGSGLGLPITPIAISDNNPGLVLDKRESSLKRRSEDTWITNRQEYGVPLGYFTTILSRNDTVSMEYSIWGNPEHLDQIENGRYRFNQSLSFHTQTSSSTFVYVAFVDIS